MAEPTDYLNMSDEDFINQGMPVNDASSANVEEVETEKPDEKVEETITDNGAETTPVEEEPKPEVEEKEENKSVEGESTHQEETPKETVTDNSNTNVNEESPNYEELYKQVLAPFKANGKTIDIKNPDEAKQLMQMGANYTKKMQELQPLRKLVATLQKNNLTDESELNFLIDLKQKNPEAIKKLIKDSGIDPLEIDTSQDSSYIAGKHQVTDEEANFRNALDDISSIPEGKELIGLIQSSWDENSKDAIWKNPAILADLTNHKQNGNFDIIKNEIDRRKMFGSIPASMPFLDSYSAIAKEFAEAESKKVKTTPIATKVVTVKPQVTNNQQAQAAAPSRTSGKKVETKPVNPLAMGDDEFLKYMESKR